jgi:TIR domain
MRVSDGLGLEIDFIIQAFFYVRIIMGKIGAFISYNHKDKKIAEAVVESLTSLSPDQLDVFIDRSGIEGGDDYEAKISDSIQKSQWFVFICSAGGLSEKDMSWSFYEAGQFRAKLEAADLTEVIRDRMCYLYDGDRPTQLARYQGSLISTTDRSDKPLNIKDENDDSLSYENTELFDFLRLILTRSAAAPLSDLNDPNVRKRMRNSVRKITLAFVQNRVDDFIGEEVFQPRISFLVPPSSQKETDGLTPDTVVTGEFNALPTIFSIGGASTTWAEIKAIVSARTGNEMTPLWINDLEVAAKDVALGIIPKQTDFLCLGSDDKFYRPIIARNAIFRSKAKRCYVAFIPSRDRRFNLSFRTSLLLSGLILSIRFRQRVLPLIDDIGKAQGVPERKKAELLQKLQQEIVLVEAEAQEFGLKPPKDEHDEPTILEGFRDGPGKELLRQEITQWSATRMSIFDKIREAQSPAKDTTWSDVAAVVMNAFSGMKAINSAFIDNLCNELLSAEKIETLVPDKASTGTVTVSTPVP